MYIEVATLKIQEGTVFLSSKNTAPLWHRACSHMCYSS